MVNKVSIIIPVYNAEKYIGSCIESILSQSFQDFEIILVDDASNDKSKDIVREFAKKDDRVILLEHPMNFGAMEARKTGYLSAHGRYIVFCDADDLFPNDSLKILVDSIEKMEADIVIGQFAKVDSKGNKTQCSPNRLLYGNDSRAVYKSLLKGEITQSLWGRIYRRSLFDEDLVCKRNFNNAEDGLLFYQVINKASLVSVIDRVVYYYRISPNANFNSSSRLTERKVYSIIFYRNFISIYFNSDRELWQLYQDKYIQIIISLLRNGISKQFLMQYVSGIQLNYHTISNTFNGLRKVYALLMFYCKPFRLLINRFL